MTKKEAIEIIAAAGVDTKLFALQAAQAAVEAGVELAVVEAAYRGDLGFSAWQTVISADARRAADQRYATKMTYVGAREEKADATATATARQSVRRITEDDASVDSRLLGSEGRYAIFAGAHFVKMA